MKRRNSTAIKFGKTVREYRKSAGFTLPTLEERSGISRGLLSKIENGTGNPSLLTIHALAWALYVTPGDLLS